MPTFKPIFSPLLTGLLLSGLGGCGGLATLPENAGYGPEPALPPPHPTLVPTVHVAPGKGWTSGGVPVAAAGLSVMAFAVGLHHPRWLYLLPDGDVLVAESNDPPRPDDGRGIKGWVMTLLMKRAGAAVPSANRITLLRDTDGDGIAETQTVFLTAQNSPFGMALVGENFYVANTDSIVRFPYSAGTTEMTAPGVKIVDLPAGTINHHWTKNIVATQDGLRLYVTVGSNSNVGENGLENEVHRAAILEVNLATGHARQFASGLRNPNGLDWEPQTGELWTTVNERDEIGSDLVPDYMTSVQDGAFYGWPYSYYGPHVDARVSPRRPDLVARAAVPDYALGAHTASLGLVFYRGNQLPQHYSEGAFIGQHGSWNRQPQSGYKVIFVPFVHGRPVGPPEDVLTGSLDAKGNAQGRPAGVAVDRAGYRPRTLTAPTSACVRHRTERTCANRYCPAWALPTVCGPLQRRQATAEHAMNWSDAMKENAGLVSRDRAFANSSDVHSAASTSWNPHDVWLTRVKQPRDRAAGRATAAALRQSGKLQD